MAEAVISKAKNDTEILAQIKEIVKSKSVELIHLQFVDIEGILKSITVTNQ
jgi:glutamine synthetase